MRTSNKNKQNIYYSNQIGKVPIYEKDKDGNIKTIIVDGVEVKVETGEYEMGYSIPKKFQGNIVLSGGEVQNVEFGFDASSYDAVLIVGKDALKLTETSLIWFKSKLAYKDKDNTIIEPNSADFRVSKVSPSLNSIKYLLTKVVK